MTLTELASRLWILRQRHPRWRPDVDWQPIVTTTVAEMDGERLVIDPLAPPSDDSQTWAWLDAHAPTIAVVILPDHVRDIDRFVERYGARGYGPRLYDPPDIPRTELKKVAPGMHLPGGAVALYEGRGGIETPLWLPQHRTIVFGDALTERDGMLRVWSSQAHEERALPAFRDMLRLPFERVIISHGEPVHDRAAFERALELPPWPCSSLHLAAWWGSLDVARRLVEHGADVNALDERYGATPLDYARMGEQHALESFLESVGGRATANARETTAG